MGNTRHIVLICLLGLLLRGEATPETASTGQVFDVTKYGAVCDGKTPANEGFLAAWAAACQFAGQSTMLVPEGAFLLKPIKFTGPCYNNMSPKVEIRGQLLAPTSMDCFANEKNWIYFGKLSQLHVTGTGTGVIDGQGQNAWAARLGKLLPLNLAFSDVTTGSLADITSMNSKGFHISMFNSNGINIHGVKIIAPDSSPNTDGIHISQATNITVTDSHIETGDDCVSIGASTSDITITNTECGPGHGISLGSLGKYPNEKEVIRLTVRNCTFTNTDNGARIKTWPGAPENTVSGVLFEDLKMNNVKNPIVITQKYCDKKGSCTETKPSGVKLTDIHFKNIKGTTVTTSAVSIVCSESVPCEQVKLTDIDLKSTLSQPLNSTCLNVQVVTAGVQSPGPCA